jgi:poly(3-hydroxybutyrate) depolymerase
LLILVTLLLNRMTLNSKNSSKPPSTDSNRKKFSKKEKAKVGNLEPEGVLFIPAADSPIGAPLVVVSHELSTSTTLYRVDEVQ